MRCNAAGEVTEIIAYGGFGLRGTISTAIGQLTKMWAFDVSGNRNVGGSLPSELFDLPSLQYLRAHNSNYNGSLPARITTRCFMYLDLQNNYFTGSVPLGIQAYYSCQLQGNCFSPCSVASPAICAFSQCRSTCPATSAPTPSPGTPAPTPSAVRSVTRCPRRCFSYGTGNPWVNVEQFSCADSGVTSAHCDLGASLSAYMCCDAFDFSLDIPASASVHGIEFRFKNVRIDRYTPGAGWSLPSPGYIREANVFLSESTHLVTPSSVDKSDGSFVLSTPRTYGSPTDTWGLVSASSAVVKPSFGICFRVQASVGDDRFGGDAATLTVHYSTGRRRAVEQASPTTTTSTTTCDACIRSFGAGWCVDASAPGGVCVQGNADGAAERECSGGWFFFTCAMPRSPALDDVALSVDESVLTAQWSGGGESVLVRLIVFGESVAAFDTSVGLPDGPIANAGRFSWELPAAFPAGGATLAVEVSKFVVDADMGASVLRQSVMSNNVTLGARDASATLVLTAFGACEPECGEGPGARTRRAFCAVDNTLRAASDCGDSVDAALSSACEIAECPVYAVSVVEPRSSVVGVVGGDPVAVRWGGGSRERRFTIELAPVARDAGGERWTGEFEPIGSSVNSSTFAWKAPAATQVGEYVVRVVDDATGDSALSELFHVRQGRVVYTLSLTLKDTAVVPSGDLLRVTLFGMRANASLPTEGANVELQRGPGWARLVSFSDEWVGELIGHESINSGALALWASLNVSASDGTRASFGAGKSGEFQLDCLHRRTCGECVSDDQCTFCLAPPDDGVRCRPAHASSWCPAESASSLLQCKRILAAAFNISVPTSATVVPAAAVSTRDGGDADDDNTLLIALVVSGAVLVLLVAAIVAAVMWRKSQAKARAADLVPMQSVRDLFDLPTEPPTSNKQMHSFRDDKSESTEFGVVGRADAISSTASAEDPSDSDSSTSIEIVNRN